MRSPIRIRLALWYTLVLTLLLLASGAGVYLLLAGSLAARAEQALRNAGTAFQELVHDEAREEPGWPALAVVREAAAEAAALGQPAAVYDSAGKLLLTPAPALHSRWGAALRRAVSARRGAPLGPRASAPLIVLGRSDERLRALVMPVRVRGETFTVALLRPVDDDSEVLEQVRRAFAVLLPLILLLAGLAGYLLARRALAPVAAMARQAERIGAGNLQARLPGGNPHDELGELAAVLNGLLQRLDDAFARQRRFMADASHELRTPTAIVRGEAEVALSRPDRAPGEYREALHVVLREAERLARTVDDLFTLARADAGRYPLVPAELYLDELVAECCRAFRTVAAERAVVVRCDAAVEAPLRGDATLLRRLLINLLDNATRHTPAGGSVCVTLQMHADEYHLDVADTGPGIAQAAVPHLFERFFRADPARGRSRAGDGAGLGLPIARWIAEAHGGRLELLRTGAEGTVFLLRLPFHKPQPGEAKQRA